MTLGHFLRAAALCGGPTEQAMLRSYLERRTRGERTSEAGQDGRTTRTQGAKTASNSESTSRREP